MNSKRAEIAFRVWMFKLKRLSAIEKLGGQPPPVQHQLQFVDNIAKCRGPKVSAPIGTETCGFLI